MVSTITSHQRSRSVRSPIQGRTFTLILLFILAISILIVIKTPDAGGVGWREEGSITSREYRDIALTDLEGDGSIEVGGILKSLEDGDPSGEFYSFDGSDWSLFSANISYKGIYSDLAIDGANVAAAHAGGNSADSWWYNDVSGVFDFVEPDDDSVTENHSLSVDIGDLNNDSYQDIVIGLRDHGIKIFYGRTDGDYDIGFTPKTKDMVKAILIADLNNDTHLDIINTHKLKDGSGSDPKKIEVWMGDGAGNWAKKTVVESINLDYSAIASGDLNDDGYLDIIAASDSKQGIDRYLFQPAGSYWEDSHVFNKGYFTSLHLSKVDHDDDLDIVGCRVDDGGINIFLGNGNGGFDTEDFGPVQSGNVTSCALHDFNDDGHIDIIAASTAGLFSWYQALPEIKDPVIPSEMYAMHDYYNLSITIVSEAILDNPGVLETARIRFNENENITFILTYDSALDQFYIDDGSQYVILDTENSTKTIEGDGSITITFRIKLKWSVMDIGSDNGGIIYAYMKEERGSTGWVEIDPGPWRIVSSVTVGDFMVDDETRNPGDPVNISGTIQYLDSIIPVHDDYLKWIVVSADGVPDSTTEDMINGTFILSITLPEVSGAFVFWPEIAMDQGDTTLIPLPELNVTVLSDYVVVTDMWVTGENYYDVGSQTYWQQGGKAITLHTGARYHYSGIPFEGELTLTNGTVFYDTLNRNRVITIDTEGVTHVILTPMNDSAIDNDYGPMLMSELQNFPEVVWDGESPALLDFAEMSLMDGSEIKAVDVEVAIIVSEQGLLEPVPVKDLGTFTIHWSIIQDENTTTNGSSPMVRGWSNGNYTFTYELPLSQAEQEDIVLFWFTGNDSVGNEFVSYLWPVRCTMDDPATVLVDPLPPGPPTGLYAEVDDGKIELRWKKNPEDDLAGYRIYRSTDGLNFSKSPISGLDLVPYHYFEDTGLENGKTYYYRITAVDSAFIPNESNFSEIISETPEEPDPEDLTSLIKDNLFFVFILVVVLAIVIQVSIMAIRNMGKSDADGQPGEGNAPATNQPFGSQPGEQGPGQSSTVTHAGHHVKQPVGTPHPTMPPPTTPQSQFPSAPSTEGHGLPPPGTIPMSSTPGVLPPVDWICPSCTNSVSLGKGERFCTSCGYKIR